MESPIPKRSCFDCCCCCFLRVVMAMLRFRKILLSTWREKSSGRERWLAVVGRLGLETTRWEWDRCLEIGWWRTSRNPSTKWKGESESERVAKTTTTGDSRRKQIPFIGIVSNEQHWPFRQATPLSNELLYHLLGLLPRHSRPFNFSLKESALPNQRYCRACVCPTQQKG